MSEVDKTIFELCNWIQKKLQLGDVKEVPKMVKALAELLSVRTHHK